MNCCARCATQVDKLWSTVEFFSRAGDFTALDLCLPCTRVVAAAIRLEVDLYTVFPFSIPLNDPEDVDDAEHHSQCHCMECDVDFKFEYLREERYA